MKTRGQEEWYAWPNVDNEGVLFSTIYIFELKAF